MIADLNNEAQFETLIRNGIPIPEDHGDTYELFQEEEVIIFAEYSITTKRDLLSYLRIRQDRVKRHPQEAIREGINPDVAVGMFERMIEVVKENPWNYAPKGFWHFIVDICKGAIVIKLIRDVGYFDEELEFVSDGYDASILLYSIDGKDFSENKVSSLYTLPETERMVLEFALGIVDAKARTTEEIADLLGIASEEVLEYKTTAMAALNINNID